MRPTWTISSAWSFISLLLESGNITVLLPTDRHSAIVGDVVFELPDLSGNIMHDLHTAVLMREHGIPRICTRDADFRRFPFVEVIDPLAK
jgi:predicted nucleic acid-binding protein